MLLFVFPDQTNFTVSPADIFEGDTVSLICDINSTSQSVTWYHFNKTISNSFRYSVQKLFFTGTSRSILNIINVTRKDSGMISFHKIVDIIL